MTIGLHRYDSEVRYAETVLCLWTNIFYKGGLNNQLRTLLHAKIHNCYYTTNMV